jgi:type I restriction enzyme S subunit
MSWRTVRLGDFLKNRQDRFKPKDAAIQNLKRVDKIDFSGNIYLSNKNSSTDMILVKQGDLLISGINVEKGAIAVYEGQEDITATIHYSSYEFDTEKIDIDFLKLFLKSPEFLQAIKEQVPGGIKTEIKPKQLLPLEVIIPQLDEQKEVVKSFSAFHSNQNSILSELNQQLALVKKLRQAYLREAMQGKLVPQDSTDEPAEILLEKIKAEKEKLVAENKIKRDKSLPPVKPEEILFEIPANWTWCKLGQIITLGPTNGYSPKANTDEKGIKCLTLTATTSGYFKTEHYKFVDVEIKEDSSLWLVPGDILLQRGNSLDYVGIAALYEGNNKEFIYPDLMIKIRTSKFVNSRFIHKCLISPFNRAYFQLKAFGAQKTMPKINQGVVLNTLISLPPLAEQERIVAKLEKLMKFCDELEANIKQGIANADRLLQTALKEALQPPATF